MNQSRFKHRDQSRKSGYKRKIAVIILGAGISGLSAAYHLKKYGYDVKVYEKEKEVGGLCRSYRHGNLIFDYGVHVSFTSNRYVRHLFAKSVNNGYEEKQVSCLNYWHGYWIKHEPQNNLHSLPKEVIKKSLIDFIHAKYNGNSEIKNYRDWCHRNFGEFFAENFSKKYTQKFWTIDYQQLTIDWIGKRLHQPDLETVIDGALDIPRDNNHYIKTFRYPKKGGFVSFLKTLEAGLDIELRTYPIKIDLDRREVYLNTGEVRSYEFLISTIPLPELIKLIKTVPKEVLAAANRLKWTSLLMLDFYVERKLSVPSQWNYYYDEKIPYTRIFYMSKLAKNNAPENCETLQVEIPYSKDKPLTSKRKKLIDRVVQCIHNTEDIGLSEINYLGETNIEYGYAIYDINRKKSLETIYKFLDANEIYYCGRFGKWEYLWSDQALLNGKEVADHLKCGEQH